MGYGQSIHYWKALEISCLLTLKKKKEKKKTSQGCFDRVSLLDFDYEIPLCLL